MSYMPSAPHVQTNFDSTKNMFRKVSNHFTFVRITSCHALCRIQSVMESWQSMQYLSVVDDYLNDLLHIRKLSRTTHTSYQSALRAYGRFADEQLGGQCTYDVILTTPLIKKYIYKMSGKGLRPCSIRAAMDSIRGSV